MSVLSDLGNLQLDVKIFSDVKYYTSGNVSEEVLKLLEDGGAQRLKYFSDFVSHVICGSSGVRESDLIDADDIYEIPAVGERWVVTCARSKTLVNTKGFLYTDKNLFSSLVFTTSELMPHDRAAVWAMVSYNGGVFKSCMDSAVSHLITASTTSIKYHKAQALNGRIVAVTPDWLVECLKQKKLVPPEQYHPRLMLSALKHSDTSRITGFEPEPEEEQPGVEEAKRQAMDNLRNHMPWNQSAGGAVQGIKVESDDHQQQAEPEDDLERQKLVNMWKNMPWNQKVFGDPRTSTSPPPRRAPGSGGRVTPGKPVTSLPSVRTSTPNSQYTYMQILMNQHQQQKQQVQQQVMQSPQQQILQSPQQQIMQSPQGQVLQSPQHVLQSPQHPIPSPQQQLVSQQQMQSQGQGQGQNQGQPVESSFLYKYIEQHMEEQKKPLPQQPQQQQQQPPSQQQPQTQQTQLLLQQLKQKQQQKQAQLLQQQLQQQQLQQQQQPTPQLQQQPQPQLQQQQQMRPLIRTPLQQQQIQMLQGQRVLISQNQHQLLLQQQQQKQQQQQLFNQQQQQQQIPQVQVQQQQQNLQIPQSPTQQNNMLLQQQKMSLQQQQQMTFMQQQQNPQQNLMQQQQQPGNMLQQNLLQQQQGLMQQGQQQPQQPNLMLQQPQQQNLLQKQQPQQQNLLQQQPQQQNLLQSQQNLLQQPPQNLLQQPPQQQTLLQQPQQPQNLLQPPQQPQNLLQQPQQQQSLLQQPQQQNLLQQTQQQNLLQQQQPQQNLLQQPSMQNSLIQQPDMMQPQQTIVSQSQSQQLPQQNLLHQQNLLLQQQQMQQQQQVLVSQHQPMNQQLMSPPPQQQILVQPNMTPPQILQQSPQHPVPNLQQKVNIIQQQQQLPPQQLLGQQPQAVMQQQVVMSQQQQQPQPPNLVMSQQPNLIMGQQFNKVQFSQQQQQQVGPVQQQQFVKSQNFPQQQQFIQGQQQGQGQFIQGVNQQNQQFVQQQQSQQIITQSPTQPQASSGQQQVWQQQVIRQTVPGGPTVARVQWSGPQAPVQRQFIHLDERTHQQLQQMAPEERAQFVNNLRKQRALAQRQQLIQLHQQRGGHIVVRSNTPVPQGLTPQQHVQWLQQAKQQGVVLQQTVQQQPGLSPIQNQPPQGQPFDPQQQQPTIRAPLRVHQLQLQREQAQAKQPLLQQQTNQMLPQGVPSSPVGPGQMQPQTQLDSTQSTRAKTALANMLSIKLSVAQTNSVENITEPSAAGTLRLMTAQHNAQMNNSNNRTQEMLALQQQQQQPPRRLNTPQVLGDQIRPQVPATPTGQGPSNDKMTSPRSVLPIQHRPGTFYGHHPNLKLPPELFLLGCIFVVVEIEDFLNAEVQDWMKVIEKYGGEIEKQYCSRITHVLCKSQRHGVVMQALRDLKRCVTVHWLSDVITRKQVLPPWMALHLPAMNLDSNPATKHLISLCGFEKDDRERVKTMITSIGATLTTYFSHHNTLLVAAKQEGRKYEHAKQWNTPVVNAQWLTEVMLGNFSALNQTEHVKYQQFGEQANFCFDPSLVPTLMHAWKMPITISQESYERVKRSASPVTMTKAKKIKTEHADSTENEPTPKSEDQKEPINENNLPQSKTHRILLSTRCVNKESKDIIKQLGGSECTDALSATHYVVAKLNCTPNLIVCIARGASVVSETWLAESQRAGIFVDEAAYIPDAKDFNQQHGCDFNLTMQTANRHRLLEGRQFYITPSVNNRNAIIEFVKACGGNVERMRRTGSRIEMIQLNAPYSYVIVADEHDLHLVADLLKRDNKIVCCKEIVISAILNQTFEVKPYLLHTQPPKPEE